VIWIVALAVVPWFSKSKSKDLLAQNSPQLEGMLTEAAAPASAAPPARITMEVGRSVEDRDAFVISGGGNLGAVAEPNYPAVAAAAPRLADRNREIGLRGEAQVSSDSRADTGAVAGQSRPGNLITSKTRAISPEATSSASPKILPGSGAHRVQSNRDNNASSVGGSIALNSADLALKEEKRIVTKYFDAGRKESDPLDPIVAAKSTLVAAKFAADEYADKTLPGRGGAAESESQQAVLNSQAFSNLGAEPAFARKKDAQFPPRSEPVLAKFKIEQAGRNVRVVDGDGSVYFGVVDEENTLYKQVVERQNQTLSNSYNNKFKFQTPKLAAAPLAPSQAEENYYLYRVEGTNRSLNQNVVFSWNFVATNEALAAGNLDYKAAAQKLDATKLPAQFPALLQNSFINGRAQFGEGREVEVNAVPVK